MSIREIRKALTSQIDDADARLLRKLFQATKSRVEGVPYERFRTDNYSQLPRISRLERGFMERNQRSGSHIQIYRLTLLALLMVNTRKSNMYFRVMQDVVGFMKKRYKLDQSKPVPLAEIIQAFPSIAKDDLIESLDYLTQSHIVTGAGADFPHSTQSLLIPQEGILAQRALEQVLETYAGYATTPISSGAVPSYVLEEMGEKENLSLMEIAAAELTNSWMSNLPQKFHPLIKEIEVGLGADQLVLPCFGLRGLVEMACYDKIGVPKNKHFSDVVDALVNQGSLTRGHGLQVSALYRYGNAVVHSGLMPNAADVKSAIIVIVSMLRHLYHTQPATDQLNVSLGTLQTQTPRADIQKMLYFAYGSNMFTERLKARVSSATFVGVASLAGYKLAWHKKSSDESGKCDVSKTNNPADCVWGAVFEIDANQKRTLDKFEALGKGYDETDFPVQLNGKPIRTFAYYATSTDPTVRPYDWYRDLVLAGAIEHGLPAEYIASIRTVETVADSNPKHAQDIAHELESARRVIATK